VEQIAVHGAAPEGVALPAAGALLALLANGVVWLVALMALVRRPTPAFVLTTLLLTALALALTFARVWAALALPWVALGGMAVLLAAHRSSLVRTGAHLVRAYQHASALQYGLVAGAICWVVLGVAHLVSRDSANSLKLLSDTFPDSLLAGLLGMALVLLTLVLGRRGLPRLSGTLVTAWATPTGALVVLGAVLVLWGGYLASVVAQLPYVGHADYADNAVVARNLVRGRGWVVDYVTQFYQLYPTVTRPQETWPLLQPVWIAPFFALFGSQSWAAKLPNLLFLAVLAALVYHAGARLWDRRVGVCAVVVLVTSHLFFKLVIYATSDLAFVVFCFAAMYLAYLWARSERSTRQARRVLWLAGAMTGLMILQKPGSGGLIAVGIGLWLLREALWNGVPVPKADGNTWRLVVRRVRPIVVWGLVAGVLLMPLIVRNVATFGKLYYSTESHDAWLLEYTDWDRIYAVYTPQGNLG
ncbi:MAG TPA: glycosyltransferase family 39 protein, partial [Roseiflexaceae bacterium]|nr:glycosyltransferase family 39 protein [Roseiflexaceae bacterium]